MRALLEQTETYAADRRLVAFWTVLLSVPAILCGFGYARQPTADGLFLFVVAVALALIPLLFTWRFKVSFTPTEFVYRRWGPTHRVPYDQIAGIEVTNRTPTRETIGAFIVTRSGKRVPFWPKLFPRAAVERFLAMAPSRADTKSHSSLRP